MENLLQQANRLDGTQGEALVMIWNNNIMDSFDFANEFEYLPKKVQKAGYKPTHRVTWTWIKQYSRMAGEDALYKTNVQYTEL